MTARAVTPSDSPFANARSWLEDVVHLRVDSNIPAARSERLDARAGIASQVAGIRPLQERGQTAVRKI